uniref:Uncharacterized protein n=1 Tax=Chaetoceros debilis TaxID=122233 RepID=A0A7S3V6B9_9STRA|mmetsp:Transcript_16340/g.24545  ORF Transcript_16340/g.24545 Transcript_16340/m.24545 type:complete len:215 (+) Transcript_16340:94-738(+)|eukprot:CAMPEP_0194117074 /NCGR_PEP_ID=MMETSP0150-20130528/29658_1 /TAXON_ID=122233 /ORGANISM="Chaetoceros debilis, Strain MM31A-1" /LENGTH=214 /DNA_ID=CAMNT_0038807953 /DNA_START=8 /DNA_END=652 /DNA_ORIENTATION=-
MIRFLALFLCAFSASAFSIGSSTRSLQRNESVQLKMGILDFLGFGEQKFDEPCVMGKEDIMSPKEHGTSSVPVQQDLRWNCDDQVADKICNFNRHSAEYRGYWRSTEFAEQAKIEYEENGEVKFYDSNTGKLLFLAPKGRDFDDFLRESVSHGWPSFRDEEVVWDDVRCLQNGEAVSLAGTHLGHNIPDFSGNRYCINLVSVAGKPSGNEASQE